MKPATKSLSVILGAYNAASHLESTLLELNNALRTLGRSYEVIVVEDGSQDDSLEILERIEDTVPELVIIRNPTNMGKGYSIRNGVLNSRGKLLIFTDADMAYSRENLMAVVEQLEAGVPIVVGNRRLEDSIYTVNNQLVRYVYRRHRTGIGFNFLVRLLFGLSARDTQSGLKGFHRDVAAMIFPYVHTRGFLFDVEIFIRAKKLSIPVLEIPVNVKFTTDESTVEAFRIFFSVLPDLVRIKVLEMKGAYNLMSPGAVKANGEPVHAPTNPGDASHPQ